MTHLLSIAVIVLAMLILTLLSVDEILLPIFVAASHQTRLDTRSKARRPIKVGIKGRGRSGRSRDSNPAGLCCSSAHLVQCEPDEASSFTNRNVGPGTYASLRLKLDAWSSAVQRGQKCSSPTRRLPSRSWGPIRPRVCSWFRAPIRHECQTAQLKNRGRAQMRYCSRGMSTNFYYFGQCDREFEFKYIKQSYAMKIQCRTFL